MAASIALPDLGIAQTKLSVRPKYHDSVASSGFVADWTSLTDGGGGSMRSA
jgi:hypothetical protein